MPRSFYSNARLGLRCRQWPYGLSKERNGFVTILQQQYPPRAALPSQIYWLLKRSCATFSTLSHSNHEPNPTMAYWVRAIAGSSPSRAALPTFHRPHGLHGSGTRSTLPTSLWPRCLTLGAGAILPLPTSTARLGMRSLNWPHGLFIGVGQLVTLP